MHDQFTVGVEEEFLTVDATTFDLRPRSLPVLDAAWDRLGAAVQPELTLAQIEIATGVCTSLEELGAELLSSRAALAEAAASRGAAVAATGTHPRADWTEQAITPDRRYLELEQEYQHLAREQLICGCHVHVAVEDPDDTVRVMDRVRPWVPVLLALSANSPYWEGVDTGYASYRTQLFDRWPTGGPAPVCGDRAGYERTIDELVAVGTVSDESYIYWHVRPSSRYPTLELRVGDVCLTADESVALAGLFRSLVRTTHAALSGPAPGDASHEMLRAATWRASRHGLDGPLVDVLRREEVPAALLVRRLLTHLRPDLIEHGEWEAVSERVEAVLDRGNGARRQRAELRRTGNLQEVTKMIVQSTNGGRLPGCGPLGADPATGAAA